MRESKERKQYNRIVKEYQKLESKPNPDPRIPFPLLKLQIKAHKLIKVIANQDAEKILTLYRALIKKSDTIQILRKLGSEMYLPAMCDGYLEYNVIPKIKALCDNIINGNIKPNSEYNYNFCFINNSIIFTIHNRKYYIECELENNSVVNITLFNCTETPSFENLCKKDSKYEHLELLYNENRVLTGMINHWSYLSNIAYMIDFYESKYN